MPEMDSVSKKMSLVFYKWENDIADFAIEILYKFLLNLA